MEDDDGSQEGPASLAMSSGMEARFVDLELIGTGSFGDVFRGWSISLHIQIITSYVMLEWLPWNRLQLNRKEASRVDDVNA